MFRRLAVVLAVIAAGLAAPAAGNASGATHCNDVFPLHAGSCGTRVAALQWLEGGHKPNVFDKVKPTFKWKPNRGYGARTKHATKAWKYRIGYPAKGQCPKTRASSTVTDTAGRQFFLILEGKVQRPTCWVSVAQQRIRIIEPGATKMALAIKALELSQLGVHEIPDNSNLGPCISFACMVAGKHYGPYQASTGAYGAAWCASFQMWAFLTIAGHLASDLSLPRAAGVLYLESWAQKHGYLNAKAKVGSLVAFLDDGGHLGYVIKVTAAGYATVEGNEGNAVREVWHPWNDRLRVFIDLPGI